MSTNIFMTPQEIASWRIASGWTPEMTTLGATWTQLSRDLYLGTRNQQISAHEESSAAVFRAMRENAKVIAGAQHAIDYIESGITADYQRHFKDQQMLPAWRSNLQSQLAGYCDEYVRLEAGTREIDLEGLKKDSEEPVDVSTLGELFQRRQGSIIAPSVIRDDIAKRYHSQDDDFDGSEMSEGSDHESQESIGVGLVIQLGGGGVDEDLSVALVGEGRSPSTTSSDDVMAPDWATDLYDAVAQGIALEKALEMEISTKLKTQTDNQDTASLSQ